MIKSLVCLVCITGIFCKAAGQSVPGYWKGSVTHQNKHWRIAIQIQKNADTLQATVDFLDIAAYEVPFSIILNAGSVRLERGQPDGKAVVFEGSILGKAYRGTFQGVGISQASFELRKTDPPAILKQEIEIRNDTITLSGTLLTPPGNRKYPLVIFIHGGSADPRRVYYGPATEFVRQGIAALVYDKRSVGRSRGGHWQRDGVRALAGDVVAWVDHLKKNARVDSSEIIVYGHSEGGWTAPVAAMLSKDIKRVIVSGASGVAASAQTMYARGQLLRQRGYSDSVIAIALDIWRQMYDATRLCYTDTGTAIKLNKAVSERIRKLHDEPWFAASAIPYIYDPACPARAFLDLLFEDPLPVWSKLKTPVLAVWGREDYIVPVDTSLTLIKNSLARSGNTDFTGKIFEGLDHSGNVTGKGGDWDFPRRSEKFFKIMIEWINKKRWG